MSDPTRSFPSAIRLRSPLDGLSSSSLPQPATTSPAASTIKITTTGQGRSSLLIWFSFVDRPPTEIYPFAAATQRFPRLGRMRPQEHLQADTPYLDALRAYAARGPGRFHVPGHKGGGAADPALAAAFGEATLSLDIPALTEGIDAGPEPTPFQRAQALAAEAWGARRSW